MIYYTYKGYLLPEYCYTILILINNNYSWFITDNIVYNYSIHGFIYQLITGGPHIVQSLQAMKPSTVSDLFAMKLSIYHVITCKAQKQSTETERPWLLLSLGCFDWFWCFFLVPVGEGRFQRLTTKFLRGESTLIASFRTSLAYPPLAFELFFLSFPTTTA